MVYDVEIARCIPDRGAPREPDLEYCGGWTDYAHMGIAVVCALDLRTRQPHVFLEDNLAGFAALIEGRTVVGFNNQGFDDHLIAAHGITITRSYDLLREIRVAAGEPPHFTPGVTRGGRKLDDVTAANLGERKTLSGALAPVSWQRGERGRVINYCLRDVHLTARLVWHLPRLVDPVTCELLDVALPVAAAGAAA